MQDAWHVIEQSKSSVSNDLALIQLVTGDAGTDMSKDREKLQSLSASTAC